VCVCSTYIYIYNAYICRCVCMYMYIYMYMYTYFYICIYICIHIYIDIYIHTHKYTYIHIYMYMYICTCTFTSICTFILHTRIIHTQIQPIINTNIQSTGIVKEEDPEARGRRKQGQDRRSLLQCCRHQGQAPPHGSPQLEPLPSVNVLYMNMCEHTCSYMSST